ncbi:MAG TPA: aldehyde dehydrogenase (NADP(+)) [Opitutae bacterium]|nr:aldehyde dehydrogenase (NADP(+)) [Opitutae bacterium]|tara:strand:+ start:21324 stop:22886 length:1563 start_codon:yes stop_codon:yes gene_type:complete
MTESSLIGFSRGIATDSTFTARNPSSGDSLEPAFCHASEEDLAKACDLAAGAAPVMAGLSGAKKAEFLRDLAERIDGVVDELVGSMTAETGLPEPRVRGETGRTSAQLRMFAGLVEAGNWVDARIDRAQPERQPLPKPDLRSMLRPVGPVAVFCASNFPLAFSVAGGDSASAWAAGCPVIVKAHHAHPATALIVGRAVVESVRACGLPEGAFSLIFGEGRTVGQALVAHPAVKAVGFTGSRAGGRALFDLASQRPEPIPVFAEMSSVNPIFVMPGLGDAKMDEIATGLHGSATLGAGQFCTNPGIVLFPAGEQGERFVESFLSKMRETAAAPMLHEGIRKAYGQGVETLAGREGVDLLLAPEETAGDGRCHATACVLTSDARSFLSDESLLEEVFGPSTLLVSYEDSSELNEVADALEGQLTASVFGKEENLPSYGPLLDILETKAGRLLFNEFPTGVEVCGAVVHGGPYPATTDGRSTSVGTGAILRFARPVCYQGFPEELLPDELKDANPMQIERTEA